MENSIIFPIQKVTSYTSIHTHTHTCFNLATKDTTRHRDTYTQRMSNMPDTTINTSTLSDLLNPSSRTDRAISEPGKGAWSYSDASEEILRLSELLAGAGVKSGDVVSIVLPNGLEFMATFLAVAHAGAVAAPLNPAYTADEFHFYMQDAGASYVIAPKGDHAARDAAQKLSIATIDAALSYNSDSKPEVVLSMAGTDLTITRDPSLPAPEDVALFLHTSGTTSRPKGVPLRHVNLMRSVSNIRDSYQLQPNDVSLVVMPLFHVHGLIGASLSTLNSGGEIVVPSRFSASSFWSQQKESGATWYSAVPTIHQILLMRADEDDAPAGCFRFIRSCSAALAPAVFDQLESRFDAPVLEAYGMTEASHQMSSSPLPPGDRIPGTVGTATGVDIAVMLDETTGKLADASERGEVVIKGENVMWGYHNNQDANSDAFVDGWFRTGDQGFLDEKGYLTLTGRLKELINRGGEKISPLEVDAVLLEHPSVAEAVCFAASDEKYGECVQAAVVLSSDAEVDDLQNHCRERLADFKVPDVIYLTDNLPRTATGKIQRRRVAAAFVDNQQ